jgi:hypothetical protein
MPLDDIFAQEHAMQNSSDRYVQSTLDLYSKMCDSCQDIGRAKSAVAREGQTERAGCTRRAPGRRKSSW